MYCPECKEIILEGELRGTNKSCHACAVRTDASDLIPMDKSARQQSAIKEPVSNNFGDYQDASQNPMMQISPSISTDNSANAIAYTNIPIIHHWDELTPAPGWKMCKYNPSTNQASFVKEPRNNKKSNNKRALLIVLAVFLLLLILLLLLYLTTDVDGASIVIIIVLLFTILLPIPFLMQMDANNNTTWIDVDKNYISIETGGNGKRSGNARIFSRNPLETEIYQDWAQQYKNSGRDVSNIDFDNRMVCIRDSRSFYRIGHFRGNAFETMLKTMLAANIQDP